MSALAKTGNLLIACVLALSLAGCAAPDRDNAVFGKALDSVQGKREATEKRLSTAAAEAIAAGKSREAMDYYRQLYAKNEEDQTIALNYAQLLRRNGKTAKALDILSPLAKKETADPVVLNEYGAALIETGDFQAAEEILRGVAENPAARDVHADTYHLIGVALDAQGRHREAEQVLRQATDAWNGDATPVMNNLALSLAGQGKFDEALTILRKALVMAPARTEIARNIEIVENLRNAVIPAAPTKLR